MKKVVFIQLDWQYSPANFIDEPTVLSHDGIQLKIDNGNVQATFDPETFQRQPYIQDKLTQLLDSFLFAKQMKIFQSYELKPPSKIEINDDGSRTHFVEVQGVVATAGVFSADTIVTDEDGNVVADSKNELKEEQLKLASTLNSATHDETLSHMTSSFKDALKDSGDELIHLYQIRDSLSKRFGSDREAKRELGISSSAWVALGKLANVLPLKQGRHRGKAVGELRDATDEELNQAREISSMLIQKYLDHIAREIKGSN